MSEWVRLHLGYDWTKVSDCCYFTLLRDVGKLCIEVDPSKKIAYISEELCIGCGICPKKYVVVALSRQVVLQRLTVFSSALLTRCPFEAIHIINLPTNLESQVTHRYGANSFKLHRLPTPRPGQVLGLVGTNGIGKSTALKILSGKLKPNLGRYDVRYCFAINVTRGVLMVPLLVETLRTLPNGLTFSSTSEDPSYRTISPKYSKTT